MNRRLMMSVKDWVLFVGFFLVILLVLYLVLVAFYFSSWVGFLTVFWILAIAALLSIKNLSPDDPERRYYP